MSSPPRTSRLGNTELAEALDRIMNKGAVLRGDLVIAVADVDLLYLDLRLVLSAVDTALGPVADRESSGDASSGDAVSGSMPSNPPPFHD